jgi:hypothetical protein
MRDKSEQVEYDREYRQEHKAKLAEYRQSYKIKIVIRMNNTEPFIGEIRKGWEIGYSRLCKYIWRSCLSCGKLQWIEFIKGKPRSVRCKGCASAKNNKDRIIPRTINNNLPSVGEIRKGRNIEGCNELNRNYIWQPCLDCGKIRWVALKKGQPERLRCKKCAKESPEWRVKISGENNSSWRDGKSLEPYTKEFNEQFKYLIRLRDSFVCQLCGVPEREYYKSLSIHHIDYNKKNCLSTNLIALCGSCNAKVNFNREYWTMYFRELLNKRQLHPNQLGHKLKKFLNISTLDEYVVGLQRIPSHVVILEKERINGGD